MVVAVVVALALASALAAAGQRQRQRGSGAAAAAAAALATATAAMGAVGLLRSLSPLLRLQKRFVVVAPLRFSSAALASTVLYGVCLRDTLPRHRNYVVVSVAVTTSASEILCPGTATLTTRP